MKKILISVFVIQMVFVAAFAYAECVDKAKLVGTWEWFDTSPESLGEDLTAAMKTLEAGEEKLGEYMEEYGIGSESNTVVMELSESGDMRLTVTEGMIMEKDSEGNEFVVSMIVTMKGTWSLECKKLTSEGSSVEKVEIPLDHLTEEQKKIAEMIIEGEKDEIEEEPKSMLEEYPPVGEILYCSEKFALIKTSYDWGDSYMIYKKQ
jgi:hypothetical protein